MHDVPLRLDEPARAVVDDLVGGERRVAARERHAAARGYYGQSAGTYDHYFQQYLPPVDVLWSFGKVIVFAVVIILVHCYYGYYASGGPAGVGVAVGRAVRTSIVAINVLDFFLSLAIWGANTTVRIAG